MKTTLLCILLATSAFAEPLAVTRPISAQALVIKQSNPSLSALESTGGNESPVPRAQAQSIIAQSEILHDGTNWTIVPKGAVLFVPEKRNAYLNARPVGMLLEWREFLAKNPAWLSTHETTFNQAAGKDPIAEEKTDFWKTQDRIIIAVHQGGPISVSR